ncbi:DUF4262 domain-containing protein [Rhodococcus sp. BP-349]|uniref:DUF4262 domain-containing protein n=1 Tax=unclassified Rhodococcus (in: high G+C Gram-positive bacteria) TaxID=192944 RepID=UPI0006F74A2B|nr:MULTISPECIES: DUF4262 domain-containing protein [unclassified Rhodococcus (in: high G+C Gram-positive bacteria)]KQU32056.1 hypothetical protein ASG69_21175 [Rhodococcus sp. Leaf225]KQU41223.1 hypothetical protein ASH03_18035 [Rhodococcus sp. Leaf258]MBY6540102.1 DUF4262 domain-containing protein [Rhodococcus sp. BP-363]MBY6543570.1 DUF4262 domain-containing protein [Rhodococcus sp. BP-369]MBY6562800.1 DUF4262 domain-containing protein [Rhodococcus sp. BP-370]
MPDIKRKIARHGWAVTAVAGSDHEVPDVAYTTGLTSRSLPELIVYGLPFHLSGSLLHDMASQMVAGLALSSGITIRSATGDEPDIVVIQAVNTADMVVTGALYSDFTALQLVWPDVDGHFPWEPEYSICAHHQPLMGVGWV